MNTKISISRYHDFSAGHRVAGHESKCAHFHGHNYRVHFICSANALDSLGRIIDFSVVKERLCEWLEECWDHRFLVYEEDPMMEGLRALDPVGVVIVPFNPTAENMAAFLLEVVGPEALRGTGVTVEVVVVEETRKCSAMAKMG